MILPTANEKKSIRVRLILDKPDEADDILAAAKEAFTCISVDEGSDNKKNVPAHVSYGDDDKTLVVKLPKCVTLRIKDAKTILKTEWGNNKVSIKTKSGVTIFHFIKGID